MSHPHKSPIDSAEQWFDALQYHLAIGDDCNAYQDCIKARAALDSIAAGCILRLATPMAQAKADLTAILARKAVRK